jgi:uncharacterized protein involved in type VI secretion and phage assembly
MSLMEIPSETTLEAGGHAKGVAVALVSQNKDDSGMGRVKVSFPWHSQPQNSYWARVAMPMTGGGRGAYFLPEVGDEVLVAFERGDLRFPYVVGSLWNGVHQSPANNQNGKNDLRVIRSRSGHILTFDDGQQPKLQLEFKDHRKKLTFDDDGIVIEDGSGNSITIKSNGGEITIQAATKLSFKAAQISLEATGTLDVKAGATLQINGALVTIN